MFIKEVEWCSIENWYPLFKKVTFKTIILPIPNEVLEYLRSDGSLILPQECTEDENTEDEIEGEKDGSGTENENNQQENPTFPHFNAQVQDALERLGGKVFPKLNWSAPKDAKWMGFGNSLQCESLSQIWLLLKSSEFITHDLTQPFKDCSDDDTSSAYENVASNVNYVLALKKWSSTINPATEFRCYIKSKKMFAIEQRDSSNFYPHINEEQDNIICDIQSFFHEYIVDKLVDEVPNVVMDVTRPTKDHVKLIDFNPFGETTDTKLFNWSELQEMKVDDDDIDFRFVETESGILYFMEYVFV